MGQLQITAQAGTLVTASLSQEVVQPLYVQQSAVGRPGVIDLGDKGNAVRPPAKSADVELFIEDNQPLVYKAQVLRLDSVDTSSVGKRKLSPSILKTGPQSKKMTRPCFDGEKMSVAAESVRTVEDVIEAILAASSATAESRISFLCFNGSHEGVLIRQEYFFH